MGGETKLRARLYIVLRGEIEGDCKKETRRYRRSCSLMARGSGAAVFKLAANAAIRPDESVGEGRKAGYERHSSRRCRVFVRAISGRDLDLAWCAIGQTYFTEVVGERSKKCDMRLRGGKAGRKARKAAKRIEAIFVIETVFSRGLLFSASPFH